MTVNYTEEKDLDKFVAKVDLDDLFTISFNADEEFSEAEIVEMFQLELFEQIAATVDEFVPRNIDS